ncbi:MAG: hypothetical protein ACREB3_01190, partial [Burkholderiales bacterium]
GVMKSLLKHVGAATTAALLLAGMVAQAGQKGQAVSLPAGTQVQVRLGSQLDTGETQAGQTFSGTIAEPAKSGGKTLLARGATVHGRVTDVVSSGRLKRPASITLELTSVRTQPLQIDGKSHLLRNAALIGGGAGAGALIGGATGGKKGALVGAAIGAGAGTATAYLTGKKEIVLPPELVLTFVAGRGGTVARAAKTAPAEPATGTTRAGQVYHGEEPRAAMGRAREDAAALMFSDRDQRMILNYFSGEGGGGGRGRRHGRGFPPGLAKRGGNLPPGLERQLQRNGTLPPGLQKKVEPFPAELTQQLPRLPSGYSRVIVEGRALILDRNNKIFDIVAIVR